MARLLVACATFLCIFQAIVERTFCFNYEPRLPVFKEGPRDSYFGFSVAEHRTTAAEPVAPYDESVIIVGAPIQQTNINATKPGGVFRCPFTSNFSDCTLLSLDRDDESIDEEGTPIKSNQWLGVSVVSQGPGGAAAACAHRFKFQPELVDEVQGLGKCYFLNSDLEKDLFSVHGYKPCRSQPKPDNYDGNLYKYCQAGTDVAVTKMSPDIDIQEYIMGIPGADNWLGGIATANVPGRALRNLISPLDHLNSGVGFNSYLGFSVASAQLTDESNVQYYIAGAPRADAMGAVLVLKKSESLLRPTFFYRINAEKPSSSFGYDVAVADLTGDGYDDLIVGAPQYFDRLPQPGVGGRVYIYENVARDGTFDVEPIKLTGERDTLFGQVVANIGDINLDGREDIAIGAPYDGMGAIYIYLGDATSVILQPAAQKITPSNLPMGINGYPFPNATFGYSISGGVDLDGNGFPELTVGAYDVEQVVILRARPVILIEEENTLSHTELDPHVTNCEYSGKPAHCFTLEICMRYYSSSDVLNDEITLDYDIETELARRDIGLGNRVVFEENSSPDLLDQSLVLPPQLEETLGCSDEIRVIVKNGFTDIFRPIPLKVTYRIRESTPVMPEPGDPLPSMSPFAMFDVSVIPEFNFEVVFTKECALDDGVCITDLVVQGSLDLQGDPPTLKVGEQTEFTLSISVENRNEDAYDAYLSITYPVFLLFSDFVEQSVMTSKCQEEDNEEGANITRKICDLGNPYASGSQDAFEIIFDARSVPADAEEFNITLIVQSTTDMEENPADNIQVITVEVESITDIIISGDGPEQMYFSGKVKGESAMVYFEDIGLPVNQEWTIFNKGPGAVNTALVTIHYPVEVENGKWLLYLTEMPYVENGRGVCNVTPAYYVNELGLKSKNSGVTYSPLPLTQSVLSRKRREAAPEAAKSTQELTIGKDITLDCASGTANCIPITCDLEPLTKEEGEVKIIIRSRLWNATFLEDYISAKSVRIVTNGSVVIESAPYITQKRTDNDKAKQVTTVIPDIKTLPPSQPLSWWVIALAVIGGLVLLILLILLLWKCGFFKRKTGYKYATVTQQQTTVKAKKDKAGYYDDAYYS